MNENARHVIPHPSGGYIVRKHGNTHGRLYSTKVVAVRKARSYGEPVYVHGWGGNVVKIYAKTQLPTNDK